MLSKLRAVEQLAADLHSLNSDVTIIAETHFKTKHWLSKMNEQTRMWANAQPDGRPAEHRWRPLFNAPKFG